MMDTLVKLDALLRKLDTSIELWFEDGQFSALYDGEVIDAPSLAVLLEEIVK